MPIAIKISEEWFSKWYLKVDPLQYEYLLTGIIIEPTDEPKKTRVKFVLSHCGEEVIAYPEECSETKDMTKMPMDEDD